VGNCSGSKKKSISGELGSVKQQCHDLGPKIRVVEKREWGSQLPGATEKMELNHMLEKKARRSKEVKESPEAHVWFEAPSVNRTVLGCGMRCTVYVSFMLKRWSDYWRKMEGGGRVVAHRQMRWRNNAGGESGFALF